MEGTEIESRAVLANPTEAGAAADRKRERRLAVVAGLVAALFLVANLATLGDQGVSWDEPAAIQRGGETLALVTALTAGRTPPALDPWIHRHPPLWATANLAISRLAGRAFGWEPARAWHLGGVVLASAGLLALFHVGRELFDATAGLAATVALAATPRFVAHAHVNPKDVPEAIFATLAILLLVRASRADGIGRWLAAAAAFAAAVATKLDALLLLPIFFLPWLACGRKGVARAGRGALARLALFLGSAAAAVFALWPALWVAPGRLFGSVAHFASPFLALDVPYLGRATPNAELPWHYTLVHLIVTSPIPVLAFAAAGAAVALRSLSAGERRFENALVLAWIAVPLAAHSIPGTPRYDGMRHVFLAMPAIALLVGLAVAEAVRRAKTATSVGGRAVVAALLLGSVGWMAVELVRIHPFEAWYLNEAARASVRPEALGRVFDFSGWGTGARSAEKWLRLHAPTGASFALVIADDVAAPERLRFRSDLVPLPSDAAARADLLVVSAAHADLLAQDDFDVVARVRRYGADLLVVGRRRSAVSGGGG